ncbi:MAG: 5-formyltetrahydrofolate cyclo-ligase [Nitrosopumilus sp.]
MGYGLGFYDRFLSKNKIPTIAITLEKQIVKNIPVAQHDIQIDWIVTEDQLINTQR